MFTIYLFHFQEIRKWKGGGGNADSKAERVNRHDGDQLTGWKKGHWKKGIRISGKGSFPEKEKKKGTATLLFIYDEHL